MNYDNSITSMIFMSDIVYVDEHILKNRDGKTTPSTEEEAEIFKNIENYNITFFNRDRRNGPRVLYLTSNLII